MTARVLVVDDSDTIRQMLCVHIELTDGVEVCGQAADGRAAVTAATEQRPDLVILDWEMPEMSGLEALREIRRTVPEAAVLMFSSKEEPGAAREALDSGAVRYFRKGTDDFDEVVAFAAGHTPA